MFYGGCNCGILVPCIDNTSFTSLTDNASDLMVTLQDVSPGFNYEALKWFKMGDLLNWLWLNDKMSAVLKWLI